MKAKQIAELGITNQVALNIVKAMQEWQDELDEGNNEARIEGITIMIDLDTGNQVVVPVITFDYCHEGCGQSVMNRLSISDD